MKHIYMVSRGVDNADDPHENDGKLFEIALGPNPPSGLTAAPASQTRINLAWTDNSNNESGFKIERSKNGTSGWTRIATVGANVTTYSDAGLSCDTTYYYRVLAYNAGGDSSYSNTANATTAVCTPAAPATITVQVSPDTLTVNTGATAMVTATMVDAAGHPMSGVMLRGAPSPSTLGSVSGLGATHVNGQAFGTWTAGSLAGVGLLNVGNGSITGTTAITLTNPAPVITSLSPTTMTVRGPAFGLRVTGTNFVGNSTVYWKGSARATTFVNSGQLVAAILASDIAASGQISITVVNPAPGGGTSNRLFFMVVFRPAAVGDYQLYLPLAARNYLSAPDLVIERIIATSNSAQVVIKNQGNAPVVDEFWVDLYVNPNPIPTGVNQVWSDGRSAQGMVWGVQVLPIAPGDVVTLTYGDAYYWPSYSRFSGSLPAGTPVYAQVDSANRDTTYGGVLENHEILGGIYNNISGPAFPTLNVMSVGTEIGQLATGVFHFSCSIGPCARPQRAMLWDFNSFETHPLATSDPRLAPSVHLPRR